MTDKKLLHLAEDNRGRLQCDTPGCGHVEPIAHAFTAELVGRPCPVCGESLLTQDDYDDSVALYANIEIANALFGDVYGTTHEEATTPFDIRTHKGVVTMIEAAK